MLNQGTDVWLSFPVIILLLIPVRTFLLPSYFTPEELGVLDAPTASPLTLESVGGGYVDPPRLRSGSTTAEVSSDSASEGQLSGGGGGHLR